MINAIQNMSDWKIISYKIRLSDVKQRKNGKFLLKIIFSLTMRVLAKLQRRNLAPKPQSLLTTHQRNFEESPRSFNDKTEVAEVVG